MKKMTKFTLIMCSICIGLGFTLCMISLALGFGTTQFYETAAERIYGGSEKMTQEYQAVKKIKIDSEFADVTVQEYDGEMIKIDGDVSRYYDVKHSDNELSIDDYRRGFHIGRWIGSYNSGSSFTVYIPREWTFEEVDITIGAGKLQVETLQTGEFKLEVGAGQAIVNNINVLKETKISCGVGSIALEGTFQNELKLDCGVGEITTNVYGKYEDYNYKVDCGVGHVNVGGYSYSGLGSTQEVKANAPNTIKIDCGVGSVRVNFKQ